MAIKLGDTVRQIVPAPIQGVVIQKQFVEGTDSFQYLVENTDDAGQTHTRWFEASDIEGVAA